MSSPSQTATPGFLREDLEHVGSQVERLARRTTRRLVGGAATRAAGVDELRSARLLFADELAAGTVTERELDRPEVARAVASRPVPLQPVRNLQRLAMKRGAFSFDRHNVGPFAAARRAVLGAGAAGPPRFLVRVDEYPLAGAYDADAGQQGDFERFHAILTEAGVPYLLAVNAEVAKDYLDPVATTRRPLSDREAATLERLRDDGVAFATHGLDHRTRAAHPRHRSELRGLSRPDLRGLLDAAHTRLARLGIRPRVFVPPFNRFDAKHYEVLAERYDVVCGGPETVPRLGFHRTPLWRGPALYLPSYPPLYGQAEHVLPAVTGLVGAQAALWLPVVLHWSWEAKAGWKHLERLARALGAHTARWDVLPSASAA